MACTASLIDPLKNKVIKTCSIDETYKMAENLIQKKNETLNKKPNKKGLYWKITIINS